ncbi:exonuclease SbcCD subunit D [Ornithinibacillus sp. 4-3]|uniref:Exonuclease SbcCD subunit D n=1 Tax=Ornithinibacillus sp. 4-3 TaxID=3231488 RepID=A0AB39HU23_9BACI
MTKEISFIHAADLHLDSPFIGLANLPEFIYQAIKDSTFQALDNLVQVAIEKQVDFVLLVGDLFDNEKQSIKAQMRLRTAFEKLSHHQIPVYLSYGNHDFIKGNKYRITFPENVFVFPSEQVEFFIYKKKRQPLATIHGFSYETRAVTTNKTIDYIVNEELSSIPYHIAMLHGSVEQTKEHDTYAPFQISELKQKPFHYWALGHIHKRQILSEHPPIIYSGNIQGRHRKETGEKGCYHVTLSESGADFSFISLEEIQFIHIDVDLTEINKIDEVEEVMTLEMSKLPEQMNYLIDLQLKIDDTERPDWQEKITEVLDWLNEQQETEDWKYIFRTRYHVQRKNDDLAGNHFIGELIHQFEDIPIENYLNELLTHPKGKKYVSDFLATHSKVLLKEEAKQLLIHELLYKRGE